MKLKEIRFHNSVKIGRDEKMYLTDREYDLVMTESGFLFCREKVQNAKPIISSMNNARYVVPEGDCGQAFGDKIASGVSSEKEPESSGPVVRKAGRIHK